jgi:acetyl esterase/lipase
VGGIDGFRDEDVGFAARLMQIGVPTELHVYPGAPHGFHLFADAAVTRRANRDVEEWLNLRLHSNA